MTLHELDSIITRVGDNCRIIFCGDFRQSDLRVNGLKDFFTILKSMDDFDFVEFTLDDIVRSGLVKEYLKAKGKYESSTK
jgi:phosphate starvation-inducible protein PhoH